MKSRALAIAGAAALSAGIAIAGTAQAATVVELTQTGCQFVESEGGLTTVATKDYAIDLAPGEYLYSCPLNPTLDYKLVVEG